MPDVSELLSAVEAGDAQAADRLLPLVYDELRARAGRLMGLERRDHTLQRTALVHEAYLRLVGSGAGFQSRLHFFAAAALAMRRILVDHARRSNLKRGGDRARVDLSEAEPLAEQSKGPIDWLELDEALRELEAIASSFIGGASMSGGVGTVLGAIIGGLLGGAKGAAIGSTVGAGAGTTAVMAGGRNHATLPAGSPLTVRLEEPATVTVER